METLKNISADLSDDIGTAMARFCAADTEYDEAYDALTALLKRAVLEELGVTIGGGVSFERRGRTTTGTVVAVNIRRFEMVADGDRLPRVDYSLIVRILYRNSEKGSYEVNVRSDRIIFNAK